MTAGANPGSGFDLTIRSVVEALQADKIVDVPLPVQNRPGKLKALGEMVESPAWKQIAQRHHFTTTFMIGAELQTFLAETQADVKTALDDASR
jgi:tripartite-type tricarboxylate transporter receptor subunit TctC